MVKVKKILWVDKEEKEASVTISDGIYSVVCFSYPFTLQEQNVFLDKLYCLDATDVVKSFKTEPLIEKKDGFYEYFLRGSLENKVVYIGEIQVDISDADIPGDIYNGDMIEFTVSRLDIY